MTRLIVVIFLVLLLSATAKAEFFNLSPNMSLPVPEVGIEPGPNYAQDINNALGLIDSHNHTPGFGVLVPAAGLNINAALPFNNNNLLSVRASRYTANTISCGSPELAETFVNGVDLYYCDGSGNSVRITQGGGVVGTPGSITGLVAPASAAYAVLTGSFSWQSAANTYALMSQGATTIYDTGASAKGVTIQAPHVLSANYTLTLPTALPGSTSILQLGSGGQITSSNVTPSPIQIGTSGTNVSSNTTTGAQNVLRTDTAIQLGPNHAYISAFADVRTLVVGDETSNTQHPIMVSANPSAHGLEYVRGGGSSTPSSTSCGSAVGEGYTCTRSATGTYVVSFSTAFTDIPDCQCTGTGTYCAFFAFPTSSGVSFQTTNESTAVALDATWTFHCSGQRGS